MNHLISMRDWDREKIQNFLQLADQVEMMAPQQPLKGKIVATCFFEPSTRTRLSFETAVKKLGAKTIGFSEGESTSTKKGESLSDTIKVVSDYADAIVIRHPLGGAARLAASVSSVPVINGGDGGNQHPSQALIDLLTIQKTQGRLDDLHIGVAGDLRCARTVRSLLQACSNFNMRIYLIARRGDELSPDLIDHLRKKGTLFSFHENLEEVLPKLDILYMTRWQAERRGGNTPFIPKDPLMLKISSLKNVKHNLRILHPLPRVNEIDSENDETPYAAYFAQAHLGVPVRMAILLNLMTGDA